MAHPVYGFNELLRYKYGIKKKRYESIAYWIFQNSSDYKWSKGEYLEENSREEKKKRQPVIYTMSNQGSEW